MSYINHLRRRVTGVPDSGNFKLKFDPDNE